MVFTVFIDHSVRVVHPSVKGREVIGRTKLFTVGRIEGVGEFHFLAASGIIRRKIDTDRIVGVHLELERDRFAGKVIQGNEDQLTKLTEDDIRMILSVGDLED